MSSREVSVLELVVGSAVILVAVVALVVPRRLAAAVSFLVFGVLLAVLWALVGAPDVALAEAALGAGVTGVLFIDAVTRTPSGERSTPPLAVARTAAATVAVTVLLAVGLTPALWTTAVPLDGASAGLTGPVAEVLPQTGVEHGVTGVLLNLRSYDTLLEVAVLLVAVLAALAVGHAGTAAGSPADGPPAPPLQTVATGVLVPVLVLLAGWLLLAGTSQPGGAFQAGAVVAALLLLLHLARRPVLAPSGGAARVLAVVGVLAFVLVAAVGPFTGGAWLQLDLSLARPVIVALETVLALSIGASLTLIALSLRQEPDR